LANQSLLLRRQQVCRNDSTAPAIFSIINFATSIDFASQACQAEVNPGLARMKEMQYTVYRGIDCTVARVRIRIRDFSSRLEKLMWLTSGVRI
jgi:hypothetical protein